MTVFTRAALAATCLFLAAPAFAHEGTIHEGCDPAATFAAGDLTVSGSFTRAMLPNARSAGGYLTIVNAGSADDRLTGATSEAAGILQLHEMRMEGDMMKMGELEAGVPIPAGGTVALAPGGLHLMFFSIVTPFKEGECIAVTLEFENAGTLPVILSVADPAAASAPEGHAHH